ncbi:hypothetical protein Ancab_003027 [Ancistrocladus abbreviatus]
MEKLSLHGWISNPVLAVAVFCVAIETFPGPLSAGQFGETGGGWAQLRAFDGLSHAFYCALSLNHFASGAILLLHVVTSYLDLSALINSMFIVFVHVTSCSTGGENHPSIGYRTLHSSKGDISQADLLGKKLRAASKAYPEVRKARVEASEETNVETNAALENVKVYKFYPVPTTDTPDVSSVKVIRLLFILY